MKRVARRRGVIIFVAFLACACVAAGITLGVRATTRPAVGNSSSSKVFGFGGPRGAWKPRVTAFPNANDDATASTTFGSGAKSVSLAEARVQATFPVLAPSADAVSAAVPDLTSDAPAADPAAGGTPADDRMRVVWLDRTLELPGRSTGSVVAIEYNHLEILEEPKNSAFGDGSKAFRAAVEQKAEPGAYLATVQGSAAYAVPPSQDEQGMAHPGEVMFMRGNVMMLVLGYYPAARLLAIANSLS